MLQNMICHFYPNSSYRNDTLHIKEDEEGFVLCQDGRIQTILPRETIRHSREESGIIVVHRKASFSGIAGAGGITLESGRTIGGWCSFSCHLISPRRFILRKGSALQNGQSATALLSSQISQILTDVFSHVDTQRQHASSEHRSIWLLVKRQVQLQLMDCGWQLDDFHPQRLQIREDS